MAVDDEGGVSKLGSMPWPKNVSDLKSKQTRILTVTFADNVEAQTFGSVPGIKNVDIVNNQLSFEISGPIDSIIKAIAKYKATITGAPCFGFEYAAKKISNKQLAGLDISCLKAAGLGGEPIRQEALNVFADKFSCIGFKRNIFTSQAGI